MSVISAPPGYGKTTLACEWLGSPAGSESEVGAAEPAVVTWLALDEDDNDPSRFCAYLVAALRVFDAGIGQETLDLVTSPCLPSSAPLMTPLINDIALSPGTVVLVLDDSHAIRTPSIHDALDFLVQHGPPNLHVVLLTREDPPLSLPTLRARGQLTELRTHDLRFTEEEAQAFFCTTMGLQVDSSVIAGLEARTEGWAAGLQLAALSVQGCLIEDLGDFLAAFSGSDRYIMDYLIEQVLRRLPADLRSFMCAVAILDRMNAPLCDAVSGRSDGKAMLLQLDQANLFLVRLDAQGQWFRFHHLFAELLQLDLSAEQQARLHRRASDWFEANGFLPEAVHHAVAGEDYVGAVRLVHLAAGALLRTGELRTLLGWIDRLPAVRVLQDGELAVHRAAASFFTGEVQEAADYLDRLESSPAMTAAAPRIHGRRLAVRAWLATLAGEMSTGRRLAGEALDLMGDDEPFYRMAALLPLGHAQSAEGETPAAEQTFRQTVAMGRQTGHALATMGGLVDLAFNLLEQGRRREALELCQSTLRQHVDRRGSPPPVARIMYLPLATSLYQANQLADAREYAIRALETSRQLLSEDIMGGDGEMILALTQYALGETDAAFATVRVTRAAAERLGYQRVANGFAAIEAELQLRAGNIAAARSWAESRRAALAGAPSVARELEYRVHVRYLLADGYLQEASRLLRDMEQLARAGRRQARLIITLIWQTITEHALQNEEAALMRLEEAVCLAAPEGFCRFFLDTGQPTLLGLLARLRQLAPEFVDGVLQAGQANSCALRDVPSGRYGGDSEPARPAQLLPEPLSSRELEVLTLLAEGLTYRQIAAKLIVAMGTIQAHCGNIYSKLGVNNRTQALTRARELHLL